MIEIIYSKENEKNEEYLRVPKNIRQIGIPDETRKIYVEDYAITFINQLASKGTKEPKAAVLVGYTTYNNSCEYIFISGVVEAEEVKIRKNNIEFLEKTWTCIYNKIKKYFPNQDIVGWFLSELAFNGESSDHIIKAHIDNFAGSDKVFMKIDPIENEEIFYVFQNGHFIRQMGYYIYYEKNEEMQEYMVQSKENIKEEQPLEQVEDHAAKSFRSIIQERKDEKHEKKIATFMYTTSSFFIMIVIAIGITMMNNYDKIKSMEQTLNSISRAVNQEDEKIATDWFAKNQNQEDDNTKEIASDESAQENDDTNASAQAAEAMNQTAIPVENVNGDVQKQETSEQNTAGTVTEINSSEEEMQKTLEESNQEEAAQESASPKEEATEPKYYTVQKGDTLAKISMNLYNTKDKVKEICELNNIENDNKIQAGQSLLLP
ncbi:LysM domain-containing protein [Lachnotalea glycerini]|uniref:LysM domain-containing protein n=1 Tax=Lachnotalea glycerini TaxID=1763509 RepID=A0A255ID16_9FIRM|nr:LysM peptidoglycan-binding domain-containing protein [Lachnotalea glycerini]PXV84593.1 LysM domain-containing protein [Lachnotalea glycerini]RDY28300.1 LysM peptidoglycan-binding domain-containing protein [Lachnotalea glycerini]